MQSPPGNGKLLPLFLGHTANPAQNGYEIMEYQQPETLSAACRNRAPGGVCSERVSDLTGTGKRRRRNLAANAGNFGIDNDAF